MNDIHGGDRLSRTGVRNRRLGRAGSSVGGGRGKTSSSPPHHRHSKALRGKSWLRETWLSGWASSSMICRRSSRVLRGSSVLSWASRRGSRALICGDITFFLFVRWRHRKVDLFHGIGSEFVFWRLGAGYLLGRCISAEAEGRLVWVV